MNKFKIALIGCGRIGWLLEKDKLRKKPCTHLGTLRELGITPNYICDLNIERLNDLQEELNLSKEQVYIDYQKLLTEQKPDLVIIATNTSSHAEITICAAVNKTQVIICEKPISYDLSTAKKMLEVCKKNETTLIINHERRFSADYLETKKIIEQKKIGQIKTITARILTGNYHGNANYYEGGGPLLHDGTHLIDMIRFLAGEIISVKGEINFTNNHPGYEDQALAWLKTEKNVNIFLESGGGYKYFVFELDIYGTDGRILVGNGYRKLFEKQESQYYEGFKDLKRTEFPLEKTGNYFIEEYKEALNILNNKQTILTSTGLDGYKALEAIHAIYYSAYKEKEIKLPLKQTVNLRKIFNLTT